MRKWISGILTVALLGVFIFSAVKLVQIRNFYKTGEETYGGAVEEFTQQSTFVSATPSMASAGAAQSVDAPADTQPSGVYAPILVDFERLQRVNPDVVGWIYCEGTVINYPVVAAPDNDYYLERSYTKESDPCGTIFCDSFNYRDFVDSNTILYGHHMQNMSMFATLKYWFEQDYYDEHPYMWLLTPTQDYKIMLFSGYETSATSDTYTIFRGHGDKLRAYLDEAVSKSRFQSDYVPSGTANYLLLSTCAYSFQLARTVLHGELVPVDSAGGYPINQTGE